MAELSIRNATTKKRRSKSPAKLKLSQSQREELYLELADYSKDGIAIYEALNLLADNYRKYKDKRERIYSTFASRLREGGTMADAFRGVIPDNELYMIEASEETDITTGFNKALFFLEKSKVLKSSMLTLITPVFLAAGLFGVIYSFSNGLFPLFAEISDPSSWGSAASSFYATGQALEAGIVPFLFILAIVIGVSVYSMPRYHGQYREILDKIPPYSFYRLFTSSGFLLSLSSMNGAGVPLNDALQKLKLNATPYLRKHIELMLFRMRSGLSQGEAITTSLFDRETQIKLSIYGASNDFDIALDRVGNKTVDITLKQIDLFSKAAGWILKVAVAASIVWIFFAIFSLGNSLSTSLQ